MGCYALSLINKASNCTIFIFLCQVLFSEFLRGCPVFLFASHRFFWRFTMDYRVFVFLVLEGAFALFLLWRSGCIVSVRSLLRCSLLIALALFIRFTYFDRENTDYQWFLKVWVDFYRTHGGFSGLRESIGNYNIPYLYFLALFSYSSIASIPCR